MTSHQPQTIPCAVRLSDQAAGREAIDRFLASHPDWSPHTFQPKDDDELNSELGSGRFSRVLFADLDALFEAIWAGHADLAQWRSAGVAIDLATPAPFQDWQASVFAAWKSLASHRRRQRRRSIAAGAILSAVAVISLWTLLSLAATGR